MATNKHALIRYRVIDRCLRNVDEQWNWQTLAEVCAAEIDSIMEEKITLSERTIKGDLQNMRNDKALGYFAPIEYDRKEKSYYYTNRSYSITESPINKSDRDQLKQMISLIRQYTGFTYLDGIGNIIQKMELLVYESMGTEKQYVHLDQPTQIPGQDWLDQLYDAIKTESAITIQYAPFDREPYAAKVSPYLLKEYKNRWYLYAYSHDKKGMRTYGLDRIKDIRSSLADYIQNDFFDPEAYFNDLIGVTLNPDAKKITVHFEVFAGQVNYIRTQPIHDSQKEIRKESNSSVFTIEIIPNYELESTLLSFGETILVLKPSSLKQKLKKRIASMSASY